MFTLGLALLLIPTDFAQCKDYHQEPNNNAPITSVPTADIKLLPDDQLFEALIQSVNQAKQEIIMAYFLCKPSDSPGNRPAIILKELIKARKRGVAISILLDRSGYFAHVDTANQRAAAILKQAGIKVKFDSPNKTTHVKMAVIDRRYCFVGSHNLTQAALSYNNELSLRIDSPSLAKELLGYWHNLR